MDGRWRLVGSVRRGAADARAACAALRPRRGGRCRLWLAKALEWFREYSAPPFPECRAEGGGARGSARIRAAAPVGRRGSGPPTTLDLPVAGFTRRECDRGRPSAGSAPAGGHARALGLVVSSPRLASPRLVEKIDETADHAHGELDGDQGDPDHDVGCVFHRVAEDADPRRGGRHERGARALRWRRLPAWRGR